MFGNSVVLNVLGEMVHCFPHIFSGCLQVLSPFHADNLVCIRNNAERVMTTSRTYNFLDQVMKRSSWRINGLQPTPPLAHRVTVSLLRSFACGVDSEQRHAALNSRILKPKWLRMMMTLMLQVQRSFCLYGWKETCSQEVLQRSPSLFGWKETCSQEVLQRSLWLFRLHCCPERVTLVGRPSRSFGARLANRCGSAPCT